jgi:hypothetical protein
LTVDIVKMRYCGGNGAGDAVHVVVKWKFRNETPTTFFVYAGDPRAIEVVLADDARRLDAGVYASVQDGSCGYPPEACHYRGSISSGWRQRKSGRWIERV